jgi:hypothetical protein
VSAVRTPAVRTPTFWTPTAVLGAAADSQGVRGVRFRSLWGFIRPVNTFFALASVLGLILILAASTGLWSLVGRVVGA